MIGDDLRHAIGHFASSEPVLVGGTEAGGGSFVTLPAANVLPGALHRLGGLAGDMVLLAIDEQIADRLGLAVSAPIDAAACRDGGWSLTDRALTMRMAAAPETRPRDLNVPGHVPTMRVERAGPLEGPAIAVELARATGLPGAVALAAVLGRNGTTVPLATARRHPQLRRLAVAPVAELGGRALERTLERDAIECSLPTRDGDFRVVGFAPGAAQTMTVALLHGDITRSATVPVYEHVHCLLGDTFATSLCDCRASLDHAISVILREGAGVILYTKRPDAEPFACGRAEDRVDAAVAAGLLARAGVAEGVPV